MASKTPPRRDQRAGTNGRTAPLRHVPTLSPVACAVCGSRRAETVLTPQSLTGLMEFHRVFHARHSQGPPALWKEKLDFLHGYATYVVRCRLCGTWYRNPSLTAAGTRRAYEADAYGMDALDLLHGIYRRQYRRTVRRLRRRLPQGSRVLEVGSYAGAFLEEGQAAGWQVEGVDVGRHVVGYARGRGLTVHLGDVRDLDLPEQAYDAAFVWHCFEQVPGPYGFLLRLRHLLRPGGLLTLRTPNAAYYGAALHAMGNAAPVARRRLAEHLAFHGLLPFPFARAYPPAGLRLLLAAWGYVEVRLADAAAAATADPTYRPWARVKGLWLDRRSHRDLRGLLADGPASPWLEVTAQRGRIEPA